MKTELFFMRTLFALVAIASVTAMSGMVSSDVVPAQKVAHQAATGTTAG